MLENLLLIYITIIKIENRSFPYDGSGTLPLIDIYFQGTVNQWASIDFGNSNAGNSVFIGGTSVPQRKLYINGELLTNVVFEEGITKINSFAFMYCNHITSVTIPNSVTYIEKHEIRKVRFF